MLLVLGCNTYRICEMGQNKIWIANVTAIGFWMDAASATGAGATRLGSETIPTIAGKTGKR